MPEKPNIFEVFYDESCPLCRREINFIRKRDRNDLLLLTDISAADFDPQTTDRTLDELMREIHGRHADGTFVIGVDVFREIYTRIGWGKLVLPTQIPGISWILDRFYDFFAKFRYRSAMKRIESQTCPLPQPQSRA